MSPKRILWFSQVGTTSSFSRITETMIPLLLKTNEEIKLTLLSNNNMNKNIPKECESRYNFLKVGSVLSDGTKFDDFDAQNKNINDRCIKYILVQICDLIQQGLYDYVIVCNGFMETEFFVKNVNEYQQSRSLNVKVVAWTPIDYIPSTDVVDSYKGIYKWITMNQVICDEILKISPGVSISWVGHGYALKNVEDVDRDTAIKKINKLQYSNWKIKKDDIIILNANNCVSSRKRLDNTIQAFYKLCKANKLKDNVKLWIHTNVQSLIDQRIDVPILIRKRTVLTHNDISDNKLALIYKVCQIGLQTSEGEGWSLTNTEHSYYGNALQIVPDFLATKFHFSGEEKQRGILIPVKRTERENEFKKKVIIGKLDVCDVCDKILEAVSLVEENKHLDIVKNANEHIEKYSWENVAKTFNDEVFSE